MTPPFEQAERPGEDLHRQFAATRGRDCEYDHESPRPREPDEDNWTPRGERRVAALTAGKRTLT
jgi:hypothetical protein